MEIRRCDTGFFPYGGAIRLEAQQVFVEEPRQRGGRRLPPRHPHRRAGGGLPRPLRHLLPPDAGSPPPGPHTPPSGGDRSGGIAPFAVGGNTSPSCLAPLAPSAGPLHFWPHFSRPCLSPSPSPLLQPIRPQRALPMGARRRTPGRNPLDHPTRRSPPHRRRGRPRPCRGRP